MIAEAECSLLPGHHYSPDDGPFFGGTIIEVVIIVGLNLNVMLRRKLISMLIGFAIFMVMMGMQLIQ